MKTLRENLQGIADRILVGGFCPQCGPTNIDEDGCCPTCGADATGPYLCELAINIKDLCARVAELEADNRRLDALVHGQDSHAVQAAWERMGGAPDPLNPGFFVCNSILTDQWEALRRAAFNEPQDQ